MTKSLCWIQGPIVSTDSLESHARLFRTFGMVEQGRRTFDPAACQRQWGTSPEVRVSELALATEGSRWGARILQFDPPSSVVVRHRTRGFDADAPKVIDFYVPDFAAARAEVERAGFALREPLAEYDLPEGHFMEGHVWGPDEIVCALITGPAAFFVNFASLTDRTFSEPQSLSGPVTTLQASIEFMREAFDFDIVNRYGIDDDSFRELVGSDRPQFNLRAINVGRDTREPYFGLIHYGMPVGSFESLAGRAVPPHRGILGATIVVDDVDARLERSLRAGATLLAPASVADTAAFGAVRCALIGAPNGATYQIVAVPKPDRGAAG
jgi:catechol 2,3-dioxygenase-like lactoylglutathione lyase family enzyme